MIRRALAALCCSLLLAVGFTAVTVINPAPAHAALPVEATDDYPVLKEGSQGTAVKMLQRVLGISADGIFGSGTKSAVITYQRNHGLTADGVVGERTWGAMLSVISEGSQGNLVRAVQGRLAITVDGIFGPATKSAVISFQKAKGLVADGYVGPKTWGAMLGVSAPVTTTPTGSLVNPYPISHTVNGGWTPRAAWLRDTIKARWGMSCTTYATSSLSSDHYTGNAMDCWGTRQQMYDLSRWTAANASSLKVSYVIFEQRIWSLARSSEGWRWMADRGSITANHYDHVHISVQN